MYYDLKFPYRISAEAGFAEDEDGNNDEAYLLTSLGNCKRNFPTEESYNEIHESHRQGLADKLGIKVEWITCITPEEYEDNACEEEQVIGEGKI